MKKWESAQLTELNINETAFWGYPNPGYRPNPQPNQNPWQAPGFNTAPSTGGNTGSGSTDSDSSDIVDSLS
jgi:hypothetical protein